MKAALLTWLASAREISKRIAYLPLVCARVAGGFGWSESHPLRANYHCARRRYIAEL